MKITGVILLIFLSYSVFGQKSVLPQSLKTLPSFKSLTLDEEFTSELIKPFHADSISEYSFLKPRKLPASGAAKNSFVVNPRVERKSGMPVVNPEPLVDLWNMPVAVPDSTVEYYIKTFPPQSGLLEK